MDTDDGVEVVWNEVRYSNRKIAKGSKVGYSDKSVVSSLASQTQPTTAQTIFSGFSVGFCMNEGRLSGTNLSSENNFD